MNKALQFFYLEFKVALRVPMSIFFAMIFPLLLLCVMVTTTKNPIIYGNFHFVDVYIPSLALLTLLSTGVTSLSVVVSINRSKKIWQTYILKGLNLYHIIFAQIAVYLLLAFISSLLAIFVAYLCFNLILPSFNNFLMFGLVWFLSSINILLLGFTIGCLLNNIKSTQQTSVIIMFLLMVFSGVFTNIQSFPLYVQNIVKYLPSTQVYYILSNYWLNNTFFEISWEVLIIWTVFLIGIIIWKLKKDNFSR
ncbi:MAG: ABC transporter permease [Methanobrevibacter sp.]|jgi:ABC-2 type transport system permease protein|nr:ABC transporter permease [Methanobrevibacter sp.]